jgi:hypothetical protein
LEKIIYENKFIGKYRTGRMKNRRPYIIYKDRKENILIFVYCIKKYVKYTNKSNGYKNRDESILNNIYLCSVNAKLKSRLLYVHQLRKTLIACNADFKTIMSYFNSIVFD